MKSSVRESDLPVVLVVDDDLTMRMLARASLEAEGFKVEELTDGIQVLSALSDIQPDIILLDVMMPEMDGFTVCLSLSRLPESKRIPVMMMTGLDDLDSINRAYQVGATDFITKPINWAILPHRIRYILRASQTLERERKLAQEMETMAEIGRIVSSTLDIEMVYKIFSQKVAKLISFDRIAINITHPEKTIFTTAYLEGFEIPGRKKGDITPLIGTATEKVFKTKSGFIIQGKEEPEIITEFPGDLPSLRSGIHSSIAMPLISNDQVIGSLILASIKDQAYTDNELRVAQRVANQISGAIANAQLLTERNRMEKEARVLEHQLRQSQKMEAVGQLAGGIAHDFNNSLTLIKVCSQLALLELKEGDPVRDKIQQIDEATQRSGDLARQLLTFGRRQIAEKKVLDLNGLLSNLDKMLRRIIGENIELINKMADDLGRVKADSGQIEQIIVNLTVNARDAMPNGGKLVLGTADVKLDEEYARAHIHVTPGSYVMLSVSDTGQGMSPEIKEHIFEPFFTTKEAGKGTGLGLFMVYGIVQNHGGHIWVDSEPGAGTIFKIYFPQVDEKMEAAQKGTLEKRLLHGGETVLVVEDDQYLRSIIAQALKRQGYKILEAADGVEGVVLFDKNKQEIDLTVTDIVMPRMSGFELTDLLKPLRPQMKVLYMSGYADHAGLIERNLNPGGNFIPKPFSLEDLSSKVSEILGK
jgi:signal transduction histidine kinase/DNA-binding response OmpR family regulator